MRHGAEAPGVQVVTRRLLMTCPVAVLALSAACNVLLGNSDHATTPDAGSDAPRDAPSDASTDILPYHAFAGANAGDWQEFPVDAGSILSGGTFDGRYVYFVPNYDGLVVRFDAKTPSALPTGYAHGSFL